MSLTELVLLLSPAQNCKKITFLDNVKTITQEENMEIRQKTSYYLHLLFLFCLYYSCLYLEIVKNHSNLVPPLVHFSL